MAVAAAGRFALTMQPAAHGDMSESFYPIVEDGYFNSLMLRKLKKLQGLR